ncbi:MAG TPA: EamA family transporter, partial [Demequina sp.]|nr:EamA family transporter [Demequina sp.]
MTEALDRRGLAYGASAYVVWGLFPILMVALKPAGAFEIVAWRALSSLLVCIAILAAMGAWRRLRAVASHRPTVLRLSAASVLIALNWGVMVYAVVTDRVAHTSLGYYINPLITVGLSVLFLGERLRKLQMVAISLGLVAVVVIAVEMGELPWI